MDTALPVAVMCGLFVGLGYLGVPVAFGLLGSVLFTTAVFTHVSLPSMIGEMFNGLDSFTLLAIPFFLLVGEIMDSAEFSHRLVAFTQSIVGHFRSGLAHVATLSSLIFAGISGSATADVVAIGRVVMPSMAREGYDPAFSAALISAASAMANMVPPSILAIVYGAAADVSIGGLFLGGVVPGVLLCIGLMLFSHFFGPPGIKREPSRFPQITHAAKRAALPLLIPVIILGGILTGQFTPYEAGMIATVYVLFLIPILNRQHVRALSRDFINAAILYSLPMMAIASATAFGRMIAYLHGQDVLAGLIGRWAGHNPQMILFLIAAMFVIVGDFLDSIPAIIIFMPIIKALADLGRINPLEMGVVVTVTLAFGLITPFYGTSLLIATTMAGRTFYQGFRRALPLYSVFLVVIVVIIVWPDLTLWLPRAILPQSAGCMPNPNGPGYICH
jgi:C4-dicarboxylate transporter, DctM subunit